MASYEERQAEAARDDRYGTLESKKTKLEEALQSWVNEATLLHSDSPLAEEKADILALRSAMIANMRTILGI